MRLVLVFAREVINLDRRVSCRAKRAKMLTHRHINGICGVWISLSLGKNAILLTCSIFYFQMSAGQANESREEY
jgi:hypothetical protein